MAGGQGHAKREYILRLDDIDCVLRVAKVGGIGQAAQQLGISQPTLSKAVGRIEADLKTRLFERDSRGVRLTAAGHLFVEHARRMATHVSDAREAVRDWKHGSTGVVRLGIGVGVPTSPVVGACAAMIDEGSAHFEIVVDYADMLVSSLRTGELDLIVCGLRETEDEELLWRPLWPEPVVPFLARVHSLAVNSAQCSLKTLRSARWVLPPSGTAVRYRFDSAFTAAGLVPPVPLVELRATGFEGELALALDAVELMPLSLANDPRLVGKFLPVDWIPELRFQRMVSLLSRRSGYMRPAVRRFVERLTARR